MTLVCSPLSSATNGAALWADGGVVRSILYRPYIVDAVIGYGKTHGVHGTALD